ncbi:MAG: DUF1192 domain-containing protein [Alphaproteobacteria bacterium]|jgi:uncharacterized small protein (DUF1192 family)|nr:DUF1192 domain-containing protein [Alphaproteobacteria bacterium]
MIEEERPQPKSTPLDGLSIEELEAKITLLKGEIARCEELVARKKAHLSAAADLFGPRSSS